VVGAGARAGLPEPVADACRIGFGRRIERRILCT
jgi:hypothetical protein